MKISDYFQEEFLLEKTKPGQKTPIISDVLVDADALVALVKKDDSNHQKAVRISKFLQKREVFCYLSPFTVAEVATVLSYKVSHRAAKGFLREMRKIDLSVLALGDKDLSLADQWFEGQTSKGTSYFDCYNMALMERYQNQIVAIFSFDAIYKKNGFKTIEL